MSDLIKRLLRVGERIPVPCPDKIKGCLVAHFRIETDPAAKEAADEIERLTAEVRRLDHSTTHTCWDECPRLACAQRREIDALRAQLAEARERERAAVVKWLEDNTTLARFHWASPLIAAIEAGEHLTRADPVRDTLADSDGDDGA